MNIMENLLTRSTSKYLLGRDINIIEGDLSYIEDKRVLVTGAGGTVGSKLSEQLLHNKAQRIYLLDNSENSLYNVHQSLINDEDKIVPILGNLQDKEFVYDIIDKLKPDIIFHCAAFKHVHLCEENPIECIKNNVFSTYNLLLAIDKIEKFIHVSTDKAVNPIGIYGISKKICEDLVLGEFSDKFVVCRFGNILGSSGSIFHLFKKQIEDGGPLTITNKYASRYFITLEEAVSLLLQIANVGMKNNIYVLNMGDLINIEKLAFRMMDFLRKDVEINYIGLRKGERMNEDIMGTTEFISYTEFEGIKAVNPFEYKLNVNIDTLKNICRKRDKDELKEYLNGKVF